MVSKTSAGDTKKTPASAKAKKTVAKKATKSVAAKSTAKSKINAQIPVKEDINPLEKVMEIKAHNEEKKVSKTAPKAAETKACCCGCADGICSVWARAYKNIFNFKGRASRYEFWGFSLMNLFFMLFVIGGLVFLSADTESAFSISTISAVALLVFLLVEFFVYLALAVRRLHDGGYTAWRGFFRPFVWNIVLCILFSIGSAYIVEKMGNQLLDADGLTQIWLSLFVFVFVVILLVCMYYGAKIFIVTSFYEEDKDNEYGEARYATACCKAKALRYTALYYIIITCMNFITQQINSYLHLVNQF